MHKQGGKVRKMFLFGALQFIRLDSSKQNQGHIGLAHDDYDLWEHCNGRKSIYILKVLFFSD